MLDACKGNVEDKHRMNLLVENVLTAFHNLVSLRRDTCKSFTEARRVEGISMLESLNCTLNATNSHTFFLYTSERNFTHERSECVCMYVNVLCAHFINTATHSLRSCVCVRMMFLHTLASLVCVGVGVDFHAVLVAGSRGMLLRRRSSG